MKDYLIGRTDTRTSIRSVYLYRIRATMGLKACDSTSLCTRISRHLVYLSQLRCATWPEVLLFLEESGHSTPCPYGVLHTYYFVILLRTVITYYVVCTCEEYRKYLTQEIRGASGDLSVYKWTLHTQLNPLLALVLCPNLQQGNPSVGPGFCPLSILIVFLA